MINFKNQKGLTLVMLFTTIIVMFILVGVTLSIAFKENGVINKAEDAANKNKLAEEKEKIEMTWTGLYIYQNHITNEDLKTKLGAGWEIDNGCIVSPSGNKFEVDQEGNVSVVEE